MPPTSPARSSWRPLERLSIELTRRCNKGCWFCYNASAPGGESRWSSDDVIALARDAAAHGLRALSLGGGEPLLFDGWRRVLDATRGLLGRGITTSGLPLAEGRVLRELIEAAPDKVQLSIHFPEREGELARVLAQLSALIDAELPAGCNLLVRADQLDAAAAAYARLRRLLPPVRIVLLPLRGQPALTPSPAALARVAGGERFGSMHCLLGCAVSQRFASIDWARRVGWCSYTAARAELAEPSYEALQRALDGLPLAFCGGALPVAAPEAA